MSKTMKWCRSLFRKKTNGSANPTVSQQDITLNSLSVENGSDRMATERAEFLMAAEEKGKGSLSTLKIMLGDGQDSQSHGPPVSMTDMLANDELFHVLEGRKFLMCTDILIDGMTDEQSLQLHGRIPVTVKRSIREDGKRVREIRLKGTLKRKNCQSKEVNKAATATQTKPPTQPIQDSGKNLRAVFSYHGFTESSNALNITTVRGKSRKQMDKIVSVKISTELSKPRNGADVDPPETDLSDKLTDIDMINRSEDVNLLVKNDHKTRIEYTTSVTTIESIARMRKYKRRPKVRKSRSCMKLKCPVATITVTRSHTRFVKYDDGFEVTEKLGNECVTLSAPRGLYFIDPGPLHSRQTKGNATEYDDCNKSASAEASEDRTVESDDNIVHKTVEVKHFPKSKSTNNDTTTFNVSALPNANNSLLANGLQWLVDKMAKSEDEDYENEPLSES